MTPDDRQYVLARFRYHNNEAKRVIKVIDGIRWYAHLNMSRKDLIDYGICQHDLSIYFRSLLP
jgi:hypothetical protein